MTKKLSPIAVVALKDALCSVYWYKGDLRSFLQSCLSDPQLISSLNWENYKRQIVSDLVDILCSQQDRYLSALTKLCYEVSTMASFQHLEQLDGGQEKARRARQAVAHLRTLVESHETIRKEEDLIAERQKRMSEKLKANEAVRSKLDDVKSRYMGMVTSSDAQKRGFQLETIMYDLFELFDLDPKASFKNIGEQIDGAFTLDGTDYLFEAKWHKELISIQAIDAFAAKARRKLENTLGVFLAINGFSPDAVQTYTGNRPNIFLMDGADLMAVLEERIDFVTLLLRKKRHAAQTGSIYLPIHQIIA